MTPTDIYKAIGKDFENGEWDIDVLYDRYKDKYVEVARHGRRLQRNAIMSSVTRYASEESQRAYRNYISREIYRLTDEGRTMKYIMDTLKIGGNVVDHYRKMRDIDMAKAEAKKYVYIDDVYEFRDKAQIGQIVPVTFEYTFVDGIKIRNMKTIKKARITAKYPHVCDTTLGSRKWTEIVINRREVIA